MPTALFSVLIEDLIFLCCQVVRSFLLRCQDFTKIFDLHGDGVIRADEFLDFGRQVFGVDLQVIGVIWFLYCPNESVIAGSITLYGIQTHSRSTFSLLSQVPLHHWLPSQRRWQGKEMNWRGSWYRGWFQSLFWPRKTFRKGSQWMSAFQQPGCSNGGSESLGRFTAYRGRAQLGFFLFRQQEGTTTSIMHSASGRTCQMLEHENGSTSCHSSCLLFVLKVTDFYLLSFGDGTLIQGNRNGNEQGLT